MPQTAVRSPYIAPSKPSANINLNDFTKEYWVPKEWVYPKATQQRTIFKQSAINNLTASIEESGQQEAIEVMHVPLTPEMLENESWNEVVVEEDEPVLYGPKRLHRRDVIAIPDDWEKGPVPHLMVKTGETRHRAVVQSHKVKLIRVKIRPYVEGLQLDLEHGIENMNREQLSTGDEARYYHKLATVYGLSVDEIAQKLGISQSKKFRIIWRLKLMNLSPRWMQLVDRGVITVQHKGKEKKIEVGDEHLRIVAEIMDNDPVSGKQTPRHDLQDMVLEAVIDEAKRTGKLMDKEKIKRIRDHIIMPPPQQDALELLLPASPHTDKAIKQLNTGIALLWKQVNDLAESQREGHPARALEYLGEVDASGLSRILAQVINNAKSLQRAIDEAAAVNFARSARTTADEALANLLSTDEILAQMDEAD